MDSFFVRILIDADIIIWSLIDSDVIKNLYNLVLLVHEGLLMRYIGMRIKKSFVLE